MGITQPNNPSILKRARWFEIRRQNWNWWVPWWFTLRI